MKGCFLFSEVYPFLRQIPERGQTHYQRCFNYRHQLQNQIVASLKQKQFGNVAGFAGAATFLEPIYPLLQQIIQENACLTLKDLAINGHDLMELGLSGHAIGECLNDLLSKVVDEELPNEKSALIAAAKRRTL